ncbi:MAG: PrsW family intramembrane metalloprotease [Planctomycetes bacterium]|nr:PrsW family intramembrane metalloprotease [Planctomycetota bacterium]NOG54787.1 PrsW family intramembrane metalloprotease [Planctomycetota bacterium]
MSKRKHLHGIEDEPALRSLRRGSEWVRTSEDSDELGEEPVRAGPGAVLHTEDDHTQAIGDEPALRSAHLDADSAPGFAQIYSRKRAATTARQRWGAIAIAAVLSGPFAVAGAFMSSIDTSWYLLLAICVFGPLIEEMLKVGSVLYLVEQRPWLIPSRVSIVMTALISGLVFSVLENFWYLYVLFPEPTQDMVAWRWSVCVVLHTGCSTIAGLGVARIWITSHRTGTLPRIALGSPYLITAIVLHGLYNFSVTVLELSGSPLMDW